MHRISMCNGNKKTKILQKNRRKRLLYVSCTKFYFLNCQFMILYGLLGVIFFIVFAAALGSRDARKKAIQAAGRLKAMETKYNDYAEKYIQNHLLEVNDLEVDTEVLAKDCLQIIKPDLDGLISLINSNTYSIVQIDYTADYFPNLAGLTEDYFRQSQKNKSRRLTLEEEENFRNIALDAIQADLKKRLLDLKFN